MYYMYFLLAIAFVYLIRTAYQILTGVKHGPSECVMPLSTPLSSSNLLGSLRKMGCEIKLISIDECNRLIEKSDDVILIDLRSGGDEKPLPFPSKRVLSITPAELVGALQWFPAGSIVVLYGTTGACGGLAKGAPILQSTKPVYVIRDTGHTEAA